MKSSTIFCLCIIFCLSARTTQDGKTVPEVLDNETLHFENNDTKSTGSWSINSLPRTKTSSQVDHFKTESVSVSSTLTIGQWTVIRCVTNGESYACDLERQVQIKELGFSDTLHFVVIGGHIKVGCQPADAKVVEKYHLNIWVDCPKMCDDNCQPEIINFGSFWFGVVSGVLFGIIGVALITLCKIMGNEHSEKSKSKSEKINE